MLLITIRKEHSFFKYIQSTLFKHTFRSITQVAQICNYERFSDLRSMYDQTIVAHIYWLCYRWAYFLSLKWYNLFNDILVGGANRETVTIHNQIFYKLSQKRDGHNFLNSTIKERSLFLYVFKKWNLLKSFTPLMGSIYFVNLVGKNYLLSAGQLLSVMCEETTTILANGKAGIGIGIFITAHLHRVSTFMQC